MANIVAYFEIFATDVERARKFYEQAFGWRFEAAGTPNCYLVVTGPKNDSSLSHGLIAKREGAAVEGPFNRLTFSVRSISETVAAIEAAGGNLRSDMADIPDVGKVFVFSDTEDNIACVMQYRQGHPCAIQ